MQWPQVFLHLAMPSSPLQKVVDAVFASHQDEPKPAMSLSSQAGGAGHWVAAVHAFFRFRGGVNRKRRARFFVWVETLRTDGLAAGRRACTAGRRRNVRRATAAGVSSGAAGGGGGRSSVPWTTRTTRRGVPLVHGIRRLRSSIARIFQESEQPCS